MRRDADIAVVGAGIAGVATARALAGYPDLLHAALPRNRLDLGDRSAQFAAESVERHEQIEMRATVSPVPYAEVARTEYADKGWRAATR